MPPCEISSKVSHEQLCSLASYTSCLSTRKWHDDLDNACYKGLPVISLCGLSATKELHYTAFLDTGNFSLQVKRKVAPQGFYKLEKQEDLGWQSGRRPSLKVTFSQTLRCKPLGALEIQLSGDLRLRYLFPRHSCVNPLLGALEIHCPEILVSLMHSSQTLWCKPISGRSGNPVVWRPLLKVPFTRHPEVHSTGVTFRFPGRGQRDTPVADAKGMLGPRSAHSSRRDCSRLPSDCPVTAQRQKVEIAYASRPPHAHAHKQTSDVANKQTHTENTHKTKHTYKSMS